MSRRIQSGHCTDALCLAVRTNAFLKTKMCPRLDNCELGKNCSFAHSDKELRPLPQFKKTAICYNYRRGKCLNPECRFAHGEEEMMGYIPQSPVQPRKICPYFILSACHDESCPNTHVHSRRAASRLKTFLVALRNAMIAYMQSGIDTVPVVELKKKLKGGIPWQSLGFPGFKESALFLPGTRFVDDDQAIEFISTTATRDLLQRLQDVIDSQKIDASPHGPFGRSTSSVASTPLLDYLPEEHEIRTPVRSVFALPQQLIRPEQVVGATAEFFICPVCEGVAVDPLITEKCSHVICRGCLNLWRSVGADQPFICPSCHALAAPEDVSPLTQDSPSPTAAALAVIYESIQIRCEHCPWAGSPAAFPLHVCAEKPIKPEFERTDTRATITPKIGSVIALDDFEETPPGLNLLSVKRGELLELEAESDSGWAYVKKVGTDETGWTPASYLGSRGCSY